MAAYGMRAGRAIGGLVLAGAIPIGAATTVLPAQAQPVAQPAAQAAPLTLPSGPAPSGDSASSLAGLFLQSCVHFVGDREALRAWARKTGLHELPAAGEQQFLYGLPGEVFDATDTHGKFVLVSEDGGSCSVLAEKVNGTAMLGDLETDMRKAQISFTVTLDQDDPQEKTLHQREYDASQGKARWHMLVSTVKGTDSGEAMLTANP